LAVDDFTAFHQIEILSDHVIYQAVLQPFGVSHEMELSEGTDTKGSKGFMHPFGAFLNHPDQ
jgi:hypothetical protein